jgi:hypothetical protein
MSVEDDDLKGLTIRDAADIAKYFEDEPQKIIGKTPVKMTEEENGGYFPSLYEQGKFRLDRNGDPLGADVLMGGADEGHHADTLAEGFDLLDGDGDDEGASMFTPRIKGNSGFNEW